MKIFTTALALTLLTISDTSQAAWFRCIKNETEQPVEFYFQLVTPETGKAEKHSFLLNAGEQMLFDKHDIRTYVPNGDSNTQYLGVTHYLSLGHRSVPTASSSDRTDEAKFTEKNRYTHTSSGPDGREHCFLFTLNFSMKPAGQITIESEDAELVYIFRQRPGCCIEEYVEAKEFLEDGASAPQ